MKARPGSCVDPSNESDRSVAGQQRWSRRAKAACQDEMKTRSKVSGVKGERVEA